VSCGSTSRRRLAGGPRARAAVAALHELHLEPRVGPGGGVLMRPSVRLLRLTPSLDRLVSGNVERGARDGCAATVCAVRTAAALIHNADACVKKWPGKETRLSGSGP